MLVPIPWQPSLYVHADLLVKLEAIRARMGRPPMLYGDSSGWRSREMQLEKWRKFLAGGNPASNPDSLSSPNTHMRGVAADLADTSAAMQRACIAVGLQRDPAENWHWQLPNWRSYPIIPSRTPSTPPPPFEENIMYQYIQRAGRSEWALTHPYLLPGGILTTTDINVANGWAPYTGDAGALIPEDRWHSTLNAAKQLHELAMAQMRAIHGGGSSTPADLAPVLNAIAEVPTAEENAQAARKAIVAP
jgi:hypothetical protein